MDRITPKQRSANMAKIRSVDTGPELTVRRIAHSMGYRFRLHRGELPGKPDLVFVQKRKVIFVHGCFWHGHGCKLGGSGPKTNQAYWSPKIARTKTRDADVIDALARLGWAAMVIWECEILAPRLLARIRKFLG